MAGGLRRESGCLAPQSPLRLTDTRPKFMAEEPSSLSLPGAPDTRWCLRREGPRGIPRAGRPLNMLPLTTQGGQAACAQQTGATLRCGRSGSWEGLLCPLQGVSGKWNARPSGEQPPYAAGALCRLNKINARERLSRGHNTDKMCCNCHHGIDLQLCHNYTSSAPLATHTSKAT